MTIEKNALDGVLTADEMIERIVGSDAPTVRERALGHALIKHFDAQLLDAVAAWAKLNEQRSWQPIETAPRDGTRVLVYACAHKRHWFGTGYYFKGVPGDGEGWIAHSFYTTPKDDASGSFEPTHWMPMLPVPETAGGDQ